MILGGDHEKRDGTKVRGNIPDDRGRGILGLLAAFAVVISVVISVGCNDRHSTPTESTPQRAGIPDVVGSYASSSFWDWRVRSGGQVQERVCGGAITIASQTRDSLSGTFRSKAPCGLVSGTVTGTVRPDGRIQISLDPDLFRAIPKSTVGSSSCLFLGEFGKMTGAFENGHLRGGGHAGFLCVLDLEDIGQHSAEVTWNAARQ